MFVLVCQYVRLDVDFGASVNYFSYSMMFGFIDVGFELL